METGKLAGMMLGKGLSGFEEPWLDCLIHISDESEYLWTDSVANAKISPDTQPHGLRRHYASQPVVA